ncbi:MAG: imidazolonepropionase [Bacillota bacterium]|nr:imidazolonepropionase [Bacillota bacterium]
MKVSLLVENAAQLVTSSGASAKPLAGSKQGVLNIIEDGSIAVMNDLIIAVGTTDQVRARVEVSAETEVVDARGKIVLPGLIDPHTHVVFGGSREYELSMKLQGIPYLEILAGGGGILNSVEATRAASMDELVARGIKYCHQMLEQGTTTAEAKSGYGLSTEAELKTLQAVREVDASQPVDLVPTFLGAHAVPKEYREAPDRYLDLVIEEMLPLVVKNELARYCDVFCEEGVFSVEQSKRVLSAARDMGLELKIHADEIVPLGGAELAAELGAVSADHLLVISDRGIIRMAEAGVIAVLLPGTTFYLKEEHYAPARKLIDAGVPVALATDFNPGSSPNNNLQLIINLACLYLRMTPPEVINAVTINAAHALGRAAEIGSLEKGKKADLVIFDAPNYDYLAYRYGTNLVDRVIKNGRICL